MTTWTTEDLSHVGEAQEIKLATSAPTARFART
jgi:hypothetical protein